MNNIEKLPSCFCNISSLSIPTAYDNAWSYEEQICLIINKLNELISVFNVDLETTIKDYIDKRFNDIIMDSLYEAETETLVLYLKK